MLSPFEVMLYLTLSAAGIVIFFIVYSLIPGPVKGD